MATTVSEGSFPLRSWKCLFAEHVEHVELVEDMKHMRLVKSEVITSRWYVGVEHLEHMEHWNL